jgi:hypothetical protein
MIMSELGRIFGFDKRKMWWYRDLPLSTVAAIMALWAVIGFMDGGSTFDRHVAVGATAAVILCFALTPNRAILLGMVVGFVATQAWFAVVFSGDPRSWWIAVPATLFEAGLLFKYRNQPIIRVNRVRDPNLGHDSR